MKKAKATAAAIKAANGAEHRRRSGGLYDLGFDDLTGGMVDQYLGADASLGLEIIGAGVVGGFGMGLMEKAETYYPDMLKGAKVTPALRTLIGATAGVVLLNYANFPGSKALGWGLGVSLAGSGALDLVKAFGLMGEEAKQEAEEKNTADGPSDGYGDELLYGAPVSIREQQLAGAPISARDVSAVEQQLQGDFAYLQ